jgi:hypothetical protein
MLEMLWYLDTSLAPSTAVKKAGGLPATSLFLLSCGLVILPVHGGVPVSVALV